MKGAIRKIECLACGSELEFLAGSLSTRCLMCEDDRPLPLRFEDDVPSTPIDDAGLSPDPIASHQHYRCDGCRALFSAATAPATCPHCAGTLTPEAATTPRIPVHAWLGSLVGLGQAKAMLTAELARHKLSDSPSRITLVYVPWLVFDVVAVIDYDGEIGHYEKHGEDTVLVWTPRSGRTERHFDNRRQTGSGALPLDLATRLEPWDWAFTRPFDPAAVHTEICERTDIPFSGVFDRVMGDYQQDMHDAAKYDIGGEAQQVHSVRPTYTDHRARLVLLPVWVGALQQSGQRFAINGRTGEAVVAGLATNEASDDDFEESGTDQRVWWLVAIVVACIVVAAVAW